MEMETDGSIMKVNGAIKAEKLKLAKMGTRQPSL
jgi:hypothetical protein